MKLKHLICHGQRTLVLQPLAHFDGDLRTTIEDQLPMLTRHPEVSAWPTILDMRLFQGVIALEDVAWVAVAFRQTRVSIGLPADSDQRESILHRGDGSITGFAEFVRGVYPDMDTRYRFTTDPQEGWDWVAPGIAMPREARRLLRAR